MLNKEDAAKFFGKLTEEQEKVLENAAAGGMSEKELCSRLRVDEKVFGDYLRTLRKEKESAVFAQEVSPDELTGVAGGYCEGVQDSKFSYTGTYMRDIYLYRYDPFKVIIPNCAATVEDGSWCGSNDACYENAVRYNENIPLETLLELAHMSKSYYMKLFRQYIGTTPYNYLLSLRITKAKELLEVTDRSVHSIARETGFSDDASFSTRFSAMTGITPLKYRRESITKKQNRSM